MTGYEENGKFPKDSEYWQQKNVVVLGGGKTGLDCARTFKNLGAKIFLSEKQILSQNIIEELNKLNILYETGKHSVDKLLTADFVIISPGIPLNTIPMDLLKEKNIPLLAEIEVAYRFTDSPLIAITGSNGKTTTTSLTAAILKKSGKNTGCGGNIGIPLIGLAYDDYEYIVAEISSFQLETIKYFRPKIGALLNLYDNHLDRHGTWQNYRDIKIRLFENQDNTDWAVLNADDERINGILNNLKGKFFSFSLTKNLSEGVFFHKNSIYAALNGEKTPIMPVSEIKLRGTHNLENCLAATAMTLLAGVPPDVIRVAIHEFTGVEHRLEIVKDINGVTFVNDSKATNYIGAVKAIESFSEPIILIAGGRDKGGEFEILTDAIKKKVKKVILLGESAPNFAQWLKEGGYNDFEIQQTLEEAVVKSQKNAQKGDIVLFSPACTSYDMFKNFEERGEVFKKYVKQLPA